MSFQNSKSVTTAGTRVPLVATTVTAPGSLYCARLTIEANAGNTNKVYVGDSNVSSTAYGVSLNPGQTYTLGMGETRGNPINLSHVYLDADTNSNGVKFYAEQI